MIRIGVIGYGYWGPNLVRNFIASGRFEVVTIADPKPDVRDETARKNPGVIIVADAVEVLARKDIEAVAIATPVSTHFALTRQALLHGKHVLIEKPLCTSVAEGEELIALADGACRVLMVDHTFLFTGAVQTIRRIVQSGEIGKICYFDSMRVNLGLFQADVNCLWDLAPHDLSVIDQLIQDKVVAIDAAGYSHFNPKLPDIVYLTLHYEDDVVAHFNLSWMSPVKVRRFAIGGTQRMLIWDDLDEDQKIRIYNSGIEFRPEDQRSTIIPDYRIGDIYSPRVSRHEALTGVVDHFAQVIEGKTESIMSAHHGLRVVRILEEAQRILDRNLSDVARLRGNAR